MTKEITARELNIDGFISEKIGEIKEIVGDGMAINALSGGVDSSTVTMLGHRALGNSLKTVSLTMALCARERRHRWWVFSEISVSRLG